jgi:hypothetical protein
MEKPKKIQEVTAEPRQRLAYQDWTDSGKMLALVTLLGQDIAKQLQAIAHGRGTSTWEMIDFGINSAFEDGSFDAAGAVDPRTGNDEIHSQPMNQQIMLLCGRDSNYLQIVNHGRERSISNQASFVFGIKAALERGAI